MLDDVASRLRAREYFNSILIVTETLFFTVYTTYSKIVILLCDRRFFYL